MMLFFGRLDAEKGWTKQLHLGALRNVNSAARETIGADTGYDTVGDFPQIRPLAAYLDLLARENALPRMILYNVNPADTFSFATLIGCFQDGKAARQDSVRQRLVVPRSKRGHHRATRTPSRMPACSPVLLAWSPTRARSCPIRATNISGGFSATSSAQDVARGELPDDEQLLGRLIEDVCYRNAANYLRLPQTR